MKIAVVTGGSSGIGRETARLLAQKGYKVYELSRSGKGGDGITHITADVTSESSIAAAFEQVDGNIDLLVCSAGMGISGATEYTDMADARYLFDVNFFGAASCIAAARRKMNGGRIIIMSSVAAALPVPYQTYYSASKSALNALTLCLRNELSRFGVTVCAVMPGDVATGFTDARRKSLKGNDQYSGSVEHSVSSMEKDERGGIRPAKVAKLVAALAAKKRVRPFYTCGGKYKIFMALGKILPRSLSNYIVGRMYD